MAEEGTTDTATPDAHTSDPTWDSLRSAWEEGGLTPGQVLGRLEASRKWEARAKAAPSPDEIATLRADAERARALDLELGTTADKAAAKAADEARSATRGEYQPALISARLDAAAARAGVSEQDLQRAVEFIDTNKFLTADGQVDADKVKAFVSTIAPATGTSTTQQQPQQPKGPTASGTGRRGGAPTPGSNVASGAELYAQKHPKKAS